MGIVANDGILHSDSSEKGAHFVQLCCQRRLPILFVQNITGFMVGRDAEVGGIAKHGAKLVHAVACAEVPKMTLIVGGSFGAGNYGMCGRAYSPRFLWMWPNARVGVMGGEQAASVLQTVGEAAVAKAGLFTGWLARRKLAQTAQQIKARFDAQSAATYATSRQWDDGIIEPTETRTTLALALAATANAEMRPTRFGVFRM